MEQQFKQFNENIRLTSEQEDDASTKTDGVCEKLHKKFYESKYNGSTKFVFGSYKTKTNVRPITPDQDVDVLFKIPEETLKQFQQYTGNGPSALLQQIKQCLEEKYTTTEQIKAWGKVVLVKFQENKHNVEVLPGFERDDGIFTIPNSEKGGSWEQFDPRKQIDDFTSSNSATNGLTADLCRMAKTWRDCTSSFEIKSYELLNHVTNFLASNYKSGAGYEQYGAVFTSFLQHLKTKIPEDDKSYVETAISRAQKAAEYESNHQLEKASREWRKIFGKDGNSEFPLAEDPKEECCDAAAPRIITNPVAPYADH